MAWSKDIGRIAKKNAEYAKEQGEYAQNEASNLSQLKVDVVEATQNANTSASIANAEVSNLTTLKESVQTATTNANTVSTNANNSATYANEQGDYAKAQGDLAKEVVDNAPVVSVNGQGGVVVLDADDVGAVPTSEKGVANGVAKLNAQGKVVDASGNEVEGKVTSVNGQTGEVTVESFSGNYNDLSNKPALSTVATTGSYNDLANKPSIPAPVTLNNTVTSTSTTQAATANAVKTAMDRADSAFQQANDGKSDIASVVGSPSTSGDTFAQLKTHIQNNKNTLASNLTARGQTSVGTDTLANLVSKVANISAGKKVATGTGVSGASLSMFTNTEGGGTVGYYPISVSGLTFIPTIIIVSARSGTDFILYDSRMLADRRVHVSLNRQLGTGYVKDIRDVYPVSVTSSGFFLPAHNVAGQTNDWIAFE